MKVKETKFKKQSSENESHIVKQFKFQSCHILCKGSGLGPMLLCTGPKPFPSVRRAYQGYIKDFKIYKDYVKDFEI